MSLYDDQIKVAKDFEYWLTHTTGTFAGLWAAAGYGKSYTTKHLVNEVIRKNSNYTPVLTSMTHSAVDVLEKFTGEPVVTLHSLMGWVPDINKETGKDTISTPAMRKNKDWDKPRIRKGMIVIIDEAGMVTHKQTELLVNECKEHGARILFIGDDKQTFPILDEDEELCVPAYEITECYLKLTIPKRATVGNIIFKLCEKYRAAVDGGKQPKLKTILNPDGKTGVRHVEDIEEMAYLAFAAGVRDGKTDDIRVLAFTNERCLTLNRKIRKKVMGIKDGIPTNGEIMIANTSITDLEDNVVIRNNQYLKVVEFEKTESSGLKGAFVLFSNMLGETIMTRPNDKTIAPEPFYVFVPESPGKLASRLRKISNEAKGCAANGFKAEASALWLSFFNLRSKCADIRYTYATTVNKAQGMTLKHVLVDMTDINKASYFNKEMAARLAYTAVSRGNTYVTIEGELND